MSATWLQTTGQVLPRLAKIAGQLRPTFHVASLAEITAADLRSLGVEAVLWDVDGTLMAHHADRIDPELSDSVTALLESPSIRHAIVSNCQEDRFSELAHIFPAVPVMLGYQTGAGAAFRVRRGDSESWRGPGAERAQDAPGELRPLRKPSGALVRAALDELELAGRPDIVLMVGDQYFTDIASANLAGIRSVKVPTLHRASFPTPVRIMQRVEAVWYRLRFGRPVLGLTASPPENGGPSP